MIFDDKDRALERARTRERYVRLRDAALDRAEAVRDMPDPTAEDTDALRLALDEAEHFNGLILSVDQATRAELRERMANGLIVDPATGRPVYAADAARAEYDRPLPEGRTITELVERDLPENQRGLSLARCLRGAILGKWDRYAEREHRAMSGLSAGAGGALLPTSLSAQVIDLARDKAQVIAAGARVVPMSDRNVDMPAWLADPTVDWRNENAAIGQSDGTVGLVSFRARTLAGATLLSREIIEDSNLSGLLEAAYAKAVALAFDQAALVGTGVAPEPLGLANVAGIDTSAASHAPTHADLLEAAGAIRARNEYPRAVIMDPATMLALGSLTGTDGHYLEMPEYLRDVRQYESGQGGANAFYMGDFAQLALGVRVEAGIRAFEQPNAANGQVLVVAWFRGDVQVLRADAFAIRTALTA